MVETGNIPLKVPFKEKDEAKSLGARWNAAGKHWYIPAGLETTPFKKWMDGVEVIPKENISPVSEAQSETNQTNDVLPESADMDDINALLREAYEFNDE